MLGSPAQTQPLVRSRLNHQVNTQPCARSVSSYKVFPSASKWLFHLHLLRVPFTVLPRTFTSLSSHPPPSPGHTL